MSNSAHTPGHIKHTKMCKHAHIRTHTRIHAQTHVFPTITSKIYAISSNNPQLLSVCPKRIHLSGNCRNLPGKCINFSAIIPMSFIQISDEGLDNSIHTDEVLNCRGEKASAYKKRLIF